MSATMPPTTFGVGEIISLKYFLLLQLLLLIGSGSGILTKYAAAHPFLSTEYCIAYAGIMLNLVVYAIAWQQIIKHLPLSLAYASKSVGLIYVVIWGVAFFDEPISIGKIIGVIIIVAGVILFAASEEL